MPADELNVKSFYDNVYESVDAYSASASDTPTYRKRVAEMSSYLSFDSLTLEIGCGRGLMSQVGPYYIGIDISKQALRCRDFKRALSSAVYLPFPGEVFDCIFSFHTLEHLESPELVLNEIDRILKLGGTVFLKPAWNCRSWNNKKLPKKPYAILTPQEKIEKASIPLRNSLILRGLLAALRRLFREVLYNLQRRPTALKYTPLTPCYIFDEYWVPDADAKVSLDPHEVIWFFKSRGYTVISHQSMLARLFARSEGVAARQDIPS
jgi:SAM-dependent methyltransferase